MSSFRDATAIVLGAEERAELESLARSTKTEHIDAFIQGYNQTARPFVWTKSEVHQKRLRPCFADP